MKAASPHERLADARMKNKRKTPEQLLFRGFCLGAVNGT